MTFNQNDQSKFFVKEVKRLLSEGIVHKKKEVAAKIGWNENAMSQVLTGTRNIPPVYYKKFTNSYNIAEPLEENAIDYKDKYIELLEKQVREKESLQQEVQALKISLALLHKELTVMAAIQHSYQEYWVEYAASKDKSLSVPQIHKTVARKSAEKLKKYQQEGIGLS